MTSTEIIAQPTWYAAFLFASDAACVTFRADTLFPHDHEGRLLASIRTSYLDYVGVREGTFSGEIGITETNGSTWTCRGLQSEPSAQIANVVTQRIIQHRTKHASRSRFVCNQGYPPPAPASHNGFPPMPPTAATSKKSLLQQRSALSSLSAITTSVSTLNTDPPPLTGDPARPRSSSSPRGQAACATGLHE